MKISYYSGCTLKTKAKNLERAAIASLVALGVEVEEIDRWNCCGAVHSLTADDLIHQVGLVRTLIRVKEQGVRQLVTLCSMCYNTLARANRLMVEDTVKRDTINRFMSEEIDYSGDVEVIQYLRFLAERIGWEAIREKVVRPLDGLRVAPYYGCTLQRPADVGIEPLGSYRLMSELIEAIGAEPVAFGGEDKCCGSYQVVGDAGAAATASSAVLTLATGAGAEAVVTSCPLCEYNLGGRQRSMLADGRIAKAVPTYYFTQLLAIALGVPDEKCHFELNAPASGALLAARSLAA